MIVANLATYPPRRRNLMRVVADIAPQVDRLNVILNQYDRVPEALSAFGNVVPLIPGEDTKDTGKFYPDVSGAQWVFMVDDDILYPADFIARTLRLARETGIDRFCAGYHGSLYLRRPKPKYLLRPRRYVREAKKRMGERRHVFSAHRALRRSTIVEQIATNAAVMPASLFPGYEYMKGSKQFVDVRLARWCHENDIACICLKRPKGYLKTVSFEESIFKGFTIHNHCHVIDEIQQFAAKVPDAGKKL